MLELDGNRQMYPNVTKLFSLSKNMASGLPAESWQQEATANLAPYQPRQESIVE